MEHSFNKDVAKIVGVNAAIIFNNIRYWCEKNRANNQHNYEGQFWTYNSIKAFEQLFPYFTNKQIRTSISKLKEFGFIDVGEFNKNPYDRTKWYCDLTQEHGLDRFLSTCTKGQMNLPNKANVHLPKRDNSIPDINTDNKTTDNKHLNLNIGTSPITEKKDSQLEIFSLEEKEEKHSKAEIKKPQTVRQKIIEFWLKEFHPGWSFSKTDGLKVNLIIKKIEKTLSLNQPDYEENDIFEFFKVFCLNLPDFYKHQGLTVLEPKYDSIIDQIKESKNGKSKRGPVFDVSFAEALAEAIGREADQREKYSGDNF